MKEEAGKPDFCDGHSPAVTVTFVCPSERREVSGLSWGGSQLCLLAWAASGAQAWVLGPGGGAGAGRWGWVQAQGSRQASWVTLAACASPGRTAFAFLSHLEGTVGVNAGWRFAVVLQEMISRGSQI